MNKFENVDIFASLDAIMRQNTGFSKVILTLTRRLLQKQRQALTERIRRCYGFAARPGRIVLRSATCS